MIQVPARLFQQMLNLIIVEQQRVPTIAEASAVLEQHRAAQQGPKLVKDVPDR